MAASSEMFAQPFDSSRKLTFVVLSLIILIAVVLLWTRLYTTLIYNRSLRQYAGLSKVEKQIVQPPQVPYTLPFLGNALAFLAPYPGQYWRNLFKTHPRDTGSCTLVLGGRKTHILFSSHAVESLFKNKQLSRHEMDRHLINKVFDLPLAEVDRYYGSGHSEEHMNKEFLLKTERVNELTAHFSRVLAERLETDAKLIDPTEPMGLFAWLRDRMFTASTTALMGEHLLVMYPDLCADFWAFDREMLGFFFETPKLLMQDAHKRRTKMLDKLEEWNKAMLEQSKDHTPLDPTNDVAWEPLYGSRLDRARQLYYAECGLSMRARSGLDLGLLFGLSSNAIPATGWILLHILDHASNATLYDRIMAELYTAQHADGSLDVPALIVQPLLLSVYHEVLRLYGDVLVTRDVDRELLLPLDDAGQRTVRLPKGGLVMAPSWLGHHDAGAWDREEAPVDTFYAERFLTRDPVTGRDSFTLSGTTGKWFPFGGGKTMCPGRVFARQEVLAAVAMVLLGFEIEVKGFIDGKGKATKSFPGLRSSYQGSGVLVMEGDMLVTIKQKKR